MTKKGFSFCYSWPFIATLLRVYVDWTLAKFTLAPPPQTGPFVTEMTELTKYQNFRERECVYLLPRKESLDIFYICLMKVQALRKESIFSGLH